MSYSTIYYIVDFGLYITAAFVCHNTLMNICNFSSRLDTITE